VRIYWRTNLPNSNFAVCSSATGTFNTSICYFRLDYHDTSNPTARFRTAASGQRPRSPVRHYTRQDITSDIKRGHRSVCSAHVCVLGSIMWLGYSCLPVIALSRCKWSENYHLVRQVHYMVRQAREKLWYLTFVVLQLATSRAIFARTNLLKSARTRLGSLLRRERNF